MLPFPRSQFAILIKTKTLALPTRWVKYEVVDFKQILAYYYPGKALAVNIDINDFRSPLIAKYGNDRECFVDSGRFTSFLITDLLYYQTDTGIEGPKFHHPEDPVSIIKCNNALLLWEGYHRILMKIVNGQTIIRAYQLDI